GWGLCSGDELGGRTLAMVGGGGMGRAVARSAPLGYGMTVVGCTRRGVPPPATLEHFGEVTNDFAAAVRHADFVSLHLSASRDNQHWLDRERLARLGGQSLLIHTARRSGVRDRARLDAP